MPLDNLDKGLFADLPANPARYEDKGYLAVDTGQFFLSDGTQWIEIGASAGGGGGAFSGARIEYASGHVISESSTELAFSEGGAHPTFDTDSYWDSDSGIYLFTVPETAKYRIDAQLTYGPLQADGAHYLYLYKTGDVELGGTWENHEVFVGQEGSMALQLPSIVTGLAAGDAVYMKATVPANGENNFTTQTDTSFFQIEKVG